jgi:hypothetical protein
MLPKSKKQNNRSGGSLPPSAEGGSVMGGGVNGGDVGGGGNGANGGGVNGDDGNGNGNDGAGMSDGALPNTPGGIPTDGAGLPLAPLEPVLRYQSEEALNAIYKKVFKPQKNGYYMNCQPSDDGHDMRNPPPASACSSLFQVIEQKYIGSFGLSRHVDIGVVGYEKVTGVSLNYLRALRAMLGRECRVLVSRELASAESPENFLVGASADPAVIAKKMTSLVDAFLGLKGNTISSGFDPAPYAPAIAKLATAATPIKTGTYINLCIAAGTDPLIIFY